VDVRLERVARTLGATPWQAFRTVTLPMAARGILSGALLMWARGISEFGAVVILAFHPMVIPVLLYERFEAFGLRAVQPVTSLVIAVCLGLFGLVQVVAGGVTMGISASSPGIKLIRSFLSSGLGRRPHSPDRFQNWRAALFLSAILK